MNRAGSAREPHGRLVADVTAEPFAVGQFGTGCGA